MMLIYIVFTMSTLNGNLSYGLTSKYLNLIIMQLVICKNIIKNNKEIFICLYFLIINYMHASIHKIKADYFIFNSINKMNK